MKNKQFTCPVSMAVTEKALKGFGREVKIDKYLK